MAETGHLEATLTELEARRARLDAAIAEIRLMLGQPVGDPGSPPGGGPGAGTSVPHDAYLGMSIPEATKKHLTTVRTKLSTKALIDALQAGGMPPLKYPTVYSVLRRREAQVQDIINMEGDWALAAWHPNWRSSKKASAKGEQDDKAEDKKEQKEHKEKEGKAAS